MKKILIFVATLCMMIVLSVSVYASVSERTWCFSDSEFSSLENVSYLKDDFTVNGLTISKGVQVNVSNSKKRNVWFDKSLYMPEYSDINSGYLKFYVKLFYIFFQYLSRKIVRQISTNTYILLHSSIAFNKISSTSSYILSASSKGSGCPSSPFPISIV